MNFNSNQFHKAIIIDANFILLPIQFRIDYLFEIRHILEGKLDFIIFQQVIDELEAKKIRIQSKKDATFQTQFHAGLRYLDQKKSEYNVIFRDEIKNMEETTDEFLLKQAILFKKNYKSVYLATNDSELKKKAHKSNIYIIYLRQGKQIRIF